MVRKGVKKMAIKKVNRKAKGKGKAAVVRQKKDFGNGNGKALKYGFDSLNKRQSLLVPDADGKAGKVTILQNVKVLSYEYGKRHGMKFRVKRTDDGQVECTRIK
jgi:hypothetical protein